MTCISQGRKEFRHLLVIAFDNKCGDMLFQKIFQSFEDVEFVALNVQFDEAHPCRYRDRIDPHSEDFLTHLLIYGMSTKRAIQYWVIPPEADAEFVAHMEDVLDVYSRPYGANLPVLCMDE